MATANLILGDCIEKMKDLPSESVDLVLTDPPYGIGYKSNQGQEKYKKRLMVFDWDNEFNFGLYFPEIMRILKKNTYCLVFGRHENFKTMIELGRHRPLIWDKCHTGMGNLNDFGIGYEFIYPFKKGTPSLYHQRVNGVIRYKHIGFFENTYHPTQKPEGIMRKLIWSVSKEGDTILDPFMGSGTTGVAALNLNRNFIGIEIDKGYFEIAQKRINAVKGQTRLWE